MDKRSGTPAPTTDLVYSPTARQFHWWTVALIALTIPLGIYMVYRGEVTQFDATTGRLYDLHKLIGFTILWLVVARLVYRFRHGAPPDEPTLAWWQKAASHLTHWGLYALLLTIPLLGWIGVSKYADDSNLIFGLIRLPRLSGVDTEAAQFIFKLHYWAAILLCLMLAAHVGAAIYHHAVRKDGVLRRMLPTLKRPS